MQKIETRSTTGGRVRGVTHNGVSRFLGIRYGTAPTGELRWRAAAPAEWSGTFDASSFGPLAPQLDTRLASGGIMPQVLDSLYPRNGSPAEGGTIGEDSLRLNIWASEDAEGLPVIVWLHGGGFVHGAGSEHAFAGDHLARSGRVVVVSLNHRLGLTGFLALEHLLGEEWRDSENAGITDILLALRWVADNIAAFGGDPARVTIAGQSGGGSKVATLTAMPDAVGLFVGGIIQSGPAQWIGDMDEARELTSRTLDLAAIPEYDAEILLELPLRYLMHLQARVQTMWRPTRGTALIPKAPYVNAPLVPLVIGYATHDFSLFLCERDDYATLAREQAIELLAQTHADSAESVLDAAVAANGAVKNGRVQLGVARALTDVSFARESRFALDRSTAAPVYGYRFDYRTEIFGGVLGATHSLDLAFAFGNTRSVPMTGDRLERHAVSTMMQESWIRFAETGDPGHDALPGWRPYTVETPHLMVIGENPALETASPIPQDVRSPLFESNIIE